MDDFRQRIPVKLVCGVQAAIKATGAASVSKLPPDSYTSVWEELLKLKDEVDANASN